jgi:hypothetical protein
MGLLKRNNTNREKGYVQFDFSRWRLTALFKSRARSEPVQVHRVVNPYHAVSIVAGSSACAAAQRQTGKRYLSAEAPQLPFAGCTGKKCICRYRHHDDRRDEPRRASDQGVPLAPWQNSERRGMRGRRVTDH